MKSDEIRANFLKFFEERGHTIERSDKIVPSNDPTLLFSSAGMVQFKSFYTGEVPIPYRRATTSQKCLRAGGKANDLDEVGKTSRHLTFFEMLGNFSFGDYFKREAIQWAWEFSTEVFKIPAESIVVSVYTDDDEAHDIWEKEIGVDPSRLVRLGASENFWGPAGDTGACGPCSELLFDRGEHIDPDATPEEDPKERFLEFWNLVFPQFDQQLDGSRPPLKNRGIDTGMGLERLAALLQKKETVFDTDGIFPIILSTEALASSAYTEHPIPFRVIADHARALSFMIADGVLPGNEGRGYVERRLLRRAARFGREIGLETPFLYKVTRTVVDQMAHQYPELEEKWSQIEKVVLTEEERFQSTLARGMDILHEVFEKMTKDGDTTVSGSELFKLHDTFGFPLDIAADMAEEKGFHVDREGFEVSMKQQREQARSAWSGSGAKAISPVYSQIREAHGDTEFTGYTDTETQSKIIALIVDGKEVEKVSEGESVEVVLDTTPFYAESGGQVGDTGLLDSVNGAAHISDTQKPIDGLFVHTAKVTSGYLAVGDHLSAQVDVASRRLTENHHTATHLLQAALQEVVGDHVHQAGSRVEPSRLRFDFTHFEGIGAERIADIERLVNRFIRTDTPVTTESMAIDEARAAGAMALFGEKYGDVVRVVKAGDISMELCGGTHVPATGVIGYFKIVTESAVSAGVRRIEAVCGEPCVEVLQAQDRAARGTASLLNVAVPELDQRVAALLEENKKLAREVAKWKQAAATGGSTNYLDEVQEVAGLKLLATQVDDQDPNGLRLIVDDLRNKLPSGVIVVGSTSEGKVSLCAAVSKDLVGRVRAGDIVKALAPIVGGGGGGKPDMAMAGGKDPSKLGDAIAKASEVVATLAG